MDRRIFEATETILKEDFANVVIIGTEEEVAKNSEGLDISKAIIVNPFSSRSTLANSITVDFPIPLLEPVTKTTFIPAESNFEIHSFTPQVNSFSGIKIVPSISVATSLIIGLF